MIVPDFFLEEHEEGLKLGPDQVEYGKDVKCLESSLLQGAFLLRALCSSERFSPRIVSLLGASSSSVTFSSRRDSSRSPTLLGACFSYEKSPEASSCSNEGAYEIIQCLLGSRDICL
jgi:hypothetical protein